METKIYIACLRQVVAFARKVIIIACLRQVVAFAPKVLKMRRLRRRTREGRRYGWMGGFAKVDNGFGLILSVQGGKYIYTRELSSLVKQNKTRENLRCLLLRRKKIFFLYL
jgi:hypothetical protein